MVLGNAIAIHTVLRYRPRQNTLTTDKKLLWWLMIPLAILLAGLTAEWVMANKAREFIVLEFSKSGKWEIQTGDIKVGLWNGSVQLDNIVIRPQTTGISIDSRTEIRVDRLTASGVQYKETVNGKNASFRKLNLNQPHAVVFTDSLKRTRLTDTVAPESTLEQKLGEVFNRFAVQSFNLNDGFIEFIQESEGDTSTFLVKGIDINARDLLIGKEVTSVDKSFFCEDIRATIDYLEYGFDNGSNKLKFDTIRMMAEDGIFSVQRVHLEPQYPKDIFTYEDEDHSDWTEVVTGEVICLGFDFTKVVAENMIRIDSVSVSDVFLESYKNRQAYQPETRKYMIYESIQRLKTALDVRTVSLNNLNPTYEELSKKGDEPGRISFTGIDGLFTGVTNIVREPDQYMRLDATGMLMNSGQLEATFRFPVDSLNKRFEVEGRLGAMPFDRINRMFEPLNHVEIESGTNTRMDFHIVGGESVAHVDMTFLYEDLYIVLLKEKDDQMKERKFLTKLINGVILKENNPDRKGIRVTETVAERDYNRSQFNYLWRCLVSGIKETVGVPGGRKQKTVHEAQLEVV